MKYSAAAPAEPARRCLRAAGVSDDHLRDRGVHLVTQGLIIGGAGSRRLQQFNLHPFRHDDAGVGCDGAQCRQQPVTLFELRIDRVGALGGRLAEFFQEHQPELDAVALEEHWPVQPVREAPDFRQEAALADALLHPQDRAYSVPQLFDFIKRGGLTFGRWIKQAPYTPHCGVIANIPQASRMVQHPLEEQYAAVELFRGTMVRHSVVVYRDDAIGGPQRIGFAGDDWPGYVPIRMPDTIADQERLPPGAAAVLINQTHTYRDLFMPIDATEKCLFGVIDGNCSIGDIVKRTLPSAQKESQPDMARAFFERLWWYDQVVVNASQPEGKLA